MLDTIYTYLRYGGILYTTLYAGVCVGVILPVVRDVLHVCHNLDIGQWPGYCV